MMRPCSHPTMGEILMVSPTKITDLGVYVNLLEYNLEGLIVLRELSRSKIRSLNKVVKLGNNFPAVVLTVDESTKSVALSKKDVSESEEKTCESNFWFAKQIHGIVKFFIRELQKNHQVILDAIMVYQTFVWSLSTDPSEIHAMLKKASKNIESVYQNLDQIDPIWAQCWAQVLHLKYKEKPVLLEAVLEIVSYESNGVQSIRSALLQGQGLATPEYPFKIKIIKPPFYSITLQTLEQEKATEMIQDAINLIKYHLENDKASIKIIKMPEIVLDKEFEVESGSSDNEENE